MQQTELERIARLEERTDNHDNRWDENKADHESLMKTVSRIDKNMFAYQRVVFTVAALIGMLAGFIVHEWEWLIGKVGH